MEKKKNAILIQAALLKWARESIGFSLEEAAKESKIDIQSIITWESNSSEIKITDLKKIAKAYKRTLSFFFLAKPPEASPIPKDFRTLDSVNIETLSPKVRLAIRKAQRNRKFYNYLLEVTETEHKKLPRIRFEADVHQWANKLRNHLGVTLKDQKEWDGHGFAFNRWIDAVERIGIPIFQIPLSKKEIRGFCLRENELPPVIVLNASDTINARIFTLFHEFYHLLLDQNDIDALINSNGEKIAHKLIEMKANEFAGSFLVPNDDFLGNELTQKYISTKEDRFVHTLSNLYKVSAEVIYRRLVIHGYVTEKEYDLKRAELKKKYEQEEIRKKEKQEQSEKPFIPNYYQDVLKASSYALSQRAFSAASEGKISTNELVTFLNVKLPGLKKVQDKTKLHYTEKIPNV